MIRVVEQWAKEHPPKTRQSEFLKQLPNAGLEDGCINILPCAIDNSYHDSEGCKEYGTISSCNKCRELYWSEEIE